MRLILLPCDPDRAGGYNRVASQDLARLRPTTEDEVICYAEAEGSPPARMRYFLRPRKKSGRKFANLATGRALSDVWTSQLRAVVRSREPREIFCGDVIFYKALRAMFPGRLMTVRLHNYFTLARIRRVARRIPVDLHFRLTLELTSRLERQIMQDQLVSPIFINPEEQRLFRLAWPGRASELWPVDCKPSNEVSHPRRARLIYFGGTGSHQACGLRRFINSNLDGLRSRHPGLELHLWGDGTERFHGPSNGVHGHGRWHGDGVPDGGDGLFVIPDLLGGGVKVKTGDALSRGLPFITTPFGAEGYSFNPERGRMVAELDEWNPMIESYFRSAGLA